MNESVEKLKEKRLKEILVEHVNGETVIGVSGELPDPIYDIGDRVQGFVDMGDCFRSNWVARNGTITNRGLYGCNFSVLTTLKRFDLAYGSGWKYDIKWDDGSISKHQIECDIKPVSVSLST